VSYGQTVLWSRSGPPERVRDVLPVLLLTAITLAGTAASARWHGETLTGPGWLFAIAAAPPLLVRRRFPLVAFVLSAGLAFAYYLSGFPAGPGILLPTLGLMNLAYRRDVPPAASAGGAVAVGVITAELLRGDPAGTFDPRFFGLLLWIAVAVALGTAARLRHSMITEARERSAERERRQAEEERLRIAREVHDVVAHSLAMINVQAGVAAHVADRRPEAAREALLAIKEASRTALSDLRATLDVLRSGGERAPTPGMARLPDLIANAQAAGIDVTVEGQAESCPLTAPVDMAAYRILQESLTNVVRHATGADSVTVRFRREDGSLLLTVRDNGTPRENPHPGNGLRGMTERAAALGGSVTAGPVEGGFAVRARLPLRGET